MCGKMQEDQTCLSSSHEWQQTLSGARAEADFCLMWRELLVIILRTGTRSDNALDLATSPKCSWDLEGLIGPP